LLILNIIKIIFATEEIFSDDRGPIKPPEQQRQEQLEDNRRKSPPQKIDPTGTGPRSPPSSSDEPGRKKRKPKRKGFPLKRIPFILFPPLEILLPPNPGDGIHQDFPTAFRTFQF